MEETKNKVKADKDMLRWSHKNMAGPV
ncbi:hypothetical protein NC652_011952 [Populus alba x Populus x berolinensis]|uniref:Uncharacterized protein n=1 Tax=Populus alba x Populus x berolinensis TaxID=444605 RepID=A0AAD6R505_9ROSI|nr:hypothetical protein NC652_011952 [Populus alba x Populus x berolinensis]KAJ7001812.1 hypothetical protein NC653_012033 [Populus alba x Populus x berolinensis]KAJ7002311.1 hypothetical protein NC653_012386 [Populus alba x Populus x berolinensis]